MNSVCLRRDVQIEPLILNWYAWSYLIPPATLARNLVHRYIPTLESYVAEPDIHAAAAKNPRLLGGPFVDLPTHQSAGAKELLCRLRGDHAELFQLSADLDSLDNLLTHEATGGSLAPLYHKLPSRIRGVVELFYDINDHAAYRLIEPLMYRLPYYLAAHQSLLVSRTKGDERPFILSTPRFPERGAIQVSRPFNSTEVDVLAKAKTMPVPYDQLADACGVTGVGCKSLSALCTPDLPRPAVTYAGEYARWRYFGHACILLETKRWNVLFDPVISYTYDSPLVRYTYEDLPSKIDFVILTHNHQDHVMLETLLQLRHRVDTVIVPRGGLGTLADPSLKLILKASGFRNVKELAEFEPLALECGEIIGVPFIGEHADLDIRTKLAYCIRVGRTQLLFAADSCNLQTDLYRRVRSMLGRMDVLFVGMECDGAPLSWLYGALRSRPVTRANDTERRLSGCDYLQARDVVESLGCREVYVYAMGQEPWLNHVMSLKYTDESRPIVESNRLLDWCRSLGVYAERLYGEREVYVAW